jgi:hypothetical protein
MSMPIWNIGLRDLTSLTSPFLTSASDPLSLHSPQDTSISTELFRRIHTIKEVALSLSQESTASYTTFTDGTFVPSCLAIGYSVISGQETSSSLLLICIALFKEIYQNVVKKKIMTLSDLKTIKIFYPSFLCSIDEMNAAVADAFDLVITSREISLHSSIAQIVPILEIESSQSLVSQQFFQAQFIFLNFLQMKAEFWIGSTEGR